MDLIELVKALSGLGINGLIILVVLLFLKKNGISIKQLLNGNGDKVKDDVLKHLKNNHFKHLQEDLGKKLDEHGETLKEIRDYTRDSFNLLKNLLGK